MAYIEIENLQITLRRASGPLSVVKNVNLSVKKGEIFGIVGESGSGKTMTCNTLLGLTPAIAEVSADKLMVGAHNLLDNNWSAIRGREVAMVSQDPAAALNPVFTVAAQIDAVLRRHSQLSKRERRARVLELLAEVGLPDPARAAASYPHQISGGMQQRALIAMALSAGAHTLIADEPTTALDVTVQAKILDLLKSLRDNLGLSILFISHDLAVISQVCDSVAVMLHGEIVESGAVKTVLESPRHPYTKALLCASPKRGSRGSELPTVAAQMTTGATPNA